MDTWTRIESGRSTFADYLHTLSADDWRQASLCAGWTVKDVVAHMLVVPTVPKLKVFASFASTGSPVSEKANTPARFATILSAAKSSL